MSKYSPGVVKDIEIIVRFVTSPMFFNSRTRKLKANFFSHVTSAGCSIQRNSIALDAELSDLICKSLSRDSDSLWIGVLSAQCNNLREIKIENVPSLSLCVYDTANKENPAHGEICATQDVLEPEDLVELRGALFAAFNDGNIIPPIEYRDGAVLHSLPQALQTRRLEA